MTPQAMERAVHLLGGGTLQCGGFRPLPYGRGSVTAASRLRNVSVAEY